MSKTATKKRARPEVDEASGLAARMAPWLTAHASRTAAVAVELGWAIYLLLAITGAIGEHMGGIWLRTIVLVAGSYGAFRRRDWGVLVVLIFGSTAALGAFGHAQAASSAGIRLASILSGLLTGGACVLLVLEMWIRGKD